MISSSVLRAEPFRFKESGVREIVAKVLLPLWNSYKFFDEQTRLLKESSNIDFMYDPDFHNIREGNVMDRWILADCQSLLRFMNDEMAGESHQFNLGTTS